MGIHGNPVTWEFFYEEVKNDEEVTRVGSRVDVDNMGEYRTLKAGGLGFFLVKSFDLNTGLRGIFSSEEACV